MQGFSFGAVNIPSSQAVMVAAQPTAKVEIYVTDWCPYCVQAIQFLKDNRVPTWPTISKKTAKPRNEKKGLLHVKAFHLQ
jgi:hypothetical protein